MGMCSIHVTEIHGSNSETGLNSSWIFAYDYNPEPLGFNLTKKFHIKTDKRKSSQISFTLN